MSNGLHTKRLLLRDATADDAHLLCEWKSQPLLREMSVGLKTKVTEANQRAEVRISHEDGNLYLIIERKEDSVPIGYIKLRWLDYSKRRCWLSYGLGLHYREGYTYEALSKLLSSLFEHEIVRQVDAEVFAFNVASQGLLEKLHFERVGERRNEYFYQGSHWAIYMYAMTALEVPLLEQDIELEKEQIAQSQE